MSSSGGNDHLLSAPLSLIFVVIVLKYGIILLAVRIQLSILVLESEGTHSSRKENDCEFCQDGEKAGSHQARSI